MKGVRAFHTGDDAVGFRELRSIGAGTVVESGYVDWAGWQVLIYLGEIDGVRTWVRYCHLAERSHLNRGDQVAAGGLVGLMGMTGVATGVHLHWEVYRGSVDRGGGSGPGDVGSTVDPRAFVRARLGGSSAGEEGDEMPDSMYAVVDGVQSWCWINWATGRVFACHTQAEANWVAGYMGSIKFDFSRDADGGGDRYKNKLGMLGLLAPKVEINGSLSAAELQRLTDQLQAGVKGALSGLVLKASV